MDVIANTLSRQTGALSLVAPEGLSSAFYLLFGHENAQKILNVQNYSNHDIVRFLETIGAQFGACQNAHTSFDETVYELLVPEKDVPKALEVFAEFAMKIR